VFNFRGAFGAIKQYPVPFAIIVLGVVVFAGSAIVGAYNKLRAKVPQLPAAK